MGWEVTIICYLLMLIIPLYASIKVRSAYNSTKKKNNELGFTGYDVAKKILDSNGLTSIYIVEVKGTMTDAYDSSRKVLRLSSEVFHGKTIAAASIAAHEAGHAVQDYQNYSWFKRRHRLGPVVSLGEKISYVLLVVGCVIGLLDLIYAGVILMGVGLFFEIVTLPCELDASKRGLAFIKDYNLIQDKDYKYAKKMLKAAAFTYVAAILTTLLQMLYYLSRFSRRD